MMQPDFEDNKKVPTVYNKDCQGEWQEWHAGIWCLNQIPCWSDHQLDSTSYQKIYRNCVEKHPKIEGMNIGVT